MAAVRAKRMTGQRDMVNIEKRWHPLYKELTEGKDAPFATMKDVFLLAAVLGYRRGRRRSLKGGREQPFRWSQFHTDTDVPLLRALAIAETGDVEVLTSLDAVLTIAEEYANEGIIEIEAQVAQGAGEALVNAVELIGTARRQGTD